MLPYQKKKQVPSHDLRLLEPTGPPQKKPTKTRKPPHVFVKRNGATASSKDFHTKIHGEGHVLGGQF